MAFFKSTQLTERFSRLLNTLILLCCAISGVHVSANPENRKGTCEKQFEQVLLTTVDCSMEVRPESLKTIMQYTNGMVTDASCTIPLKFNKADVYGQWIEKDAVKLPKFEVKCQLVSSNQEKLPVTTFIQPACKRSKEQQWECQINMSETMGLGMLGTLLENQVNSSKMLQTAMIQYLKSIGG